VCSYAKAVHEACSLPTVWSSDVAVYIGPGAAKCPYNNTAVYGSITYDLDHQAVRIDVVRGGKGPSTNWVLYDSDGAHWHSFDRESRKCKNGTYQGSMGKIDLKKDATFKHQFSIGTQIEEAWKFNKRDALITVTHGSCLPTKIVAWSKTKGLRYTVSFLNLVSHAGSFTFDLPTECRDAKPSDRDDFLEIMQDIFAGKSHDYDGDTEDRHPFIFGIPNLFV